MKKEKQAHRTEIRLNESLYNDIKGISEELNCSMNCAMCMLMWIGIQTYMAPFRNRNLPTAE